MSETQMTTTTTDTHFMVFENEDFGSVRSMIIDKEPWFVGKDVCLMFGDKNHNRSLSRIDEIDRNIIEIIDSRKRKQNAIIINESGLYSLLFTMQPQKAHNYGVSDEYPIEVQERIDKLHKFKHWITSEVIPSIRKTGSYSISGNNNSELFSEINILKQELAEIKTMLVPSQPNYFLWKKTIANPLVESISKIFDLPIADTYKVIYDDMTSHGFSQPFAMDRFCHKYLVDNISTIDAIADVDNYVNMFMESCNRLLSVKTEENNADITPSNNRVDDNITNTNIDYSTMTVEEIIQPLVNLYNDTSVNNVYTYKRVYKVMRSDRSWKALMTRRHCKSKKALVLKFADIKRDFSKVVNQLMEAGAV